MQRYSQMFLGSLKFLKKTYYGAHALTIQGSQYIKICLNNLNSFVFLYTVDRCPSKPLRPSAHVSVMFMTVKRTYRWGVESFNILEIFHWSMESLDELSNQAHSTPLILEKGNRGIQFFGVKHILYDK